jgi:DNA-binding NarL/FixJ family response regulator
MTVRVLLADDHQLFRQGMRSLLANDARFEVIGEAENGRSAVELSRQLVPDVVVMDISMPDLNGIDAARRIKKTSPGIQVLALSAHADRRFVAQMLAAGASGYLLKDCAVDELCRAVSAVARKQVYLSPAVAGDMVDVYLGRSAQSAAGGPGPLTSRQREVLQLVAEGLNTKRIAARLHVSLKTVETHRAQIMQKLDCQSVAELTKYAIRQGITSL